MFINIARMLWSFNFSKKIGLDGVVIEPDTNTEKGWMTVPKKFVCDITVRSEKHAAVIRDAFVDAESRGMEFDFEKIKEKPGTHRA